MQGTGISTSINEDGKLEFTFPAEGDTAFFRLQSE